MKKQLLIIITLILLLCLFMASCEKGSTGVTTTDSDESTTNTSSDGTHSHVYGEWITLNDATCQQTGTKVCVCSCGNQKTETIEKKLCHYVNDVCTMCHTKKPTTFVPDYTKGEENIVGSDNANFGFTAQSDYLYYANQNEIEKIKRNGSAHQSVYTVSSGSLCNINVIGDWIYFYCKESTTAKSYIAKVKTDGSGFEKLVSSVNVWEMLVVNNIVYYTTVTQNWEYTEYAKDILPLYSLSVNGGTPKQIQDGAVSYLTADGTYLYYSHTTNNDKTTICRIKHSNAKKDILHQNITAVNLTLENSKLYFFVENIYEPETFTLASISINGGSYTTYGKMFCDPNLFHVIGNKAYFIGSAPISENNPEPEYGLTEYSLTTKKFKLIGGGEHGEFVGAFDLLIFQPTVPGKFNTIEIYISSTGAFKKLKVS